MSIDLSQFHQVFFEESFEGLDAMEGGLLDLSPEDFDVEMINTIFRAAHSIKGGAGTFGFQVAADFTHVVETLLDEIRSGTRNLVSSHVDLLLRSVDCLREIMQALQDEEEVDTSAANALQQEFEAILSGNDEDASETSESGADLSSDVDQMADPHIAASQAADQNTTEAESSSGYWLIYFKPDADVLRTGNEPLRMFRELEALGPLKVAAITDGLPEFTQLEPEACYFAWNLALQGGARAEVDEVFEWVIDESELSIHWVESNFDEVELNAQPSVDQQQEVVPDGQEMASEAQSVSILEAVEQAATQRPESLSPSSESVSETTAKASTAPSSEVQAPEAQALGTQAPVTQTSVTKASAKAAKAVKKSSASSEATSIRVGIDKIDSLINMVGELVITQSMLGQLGDNFDMNKLVRLQEGLAQLEHNTRELQESVMRIRMLPISFTFSRFPRLVRDLSKSLDKKIDLVLLGESTELDKTVMEKIGDPMVHLVRNSLDHGIEKPEDRVAAGKPETGTITLNAFHQGGNIVIQIIDDGNGLNRDRILSKAIENGLVSESDRLTDEQICDLIFQPGFSTADQVSDISGRGVGMDVVRRNIQELNGTVEVQSTPGEGSTFTIRLPLTLAILDGQLVRVGKEVFILPLVSIVESLQVDLSMINNVGGRSEVLRLRDEYVPIVKLHDVLNVTPDNYALESGLLVVVEGDNTKVGLFVDDLLAQQQVVIKSLEQNYERVEGISGATILGDGKVALIVDITGIMKIAHQDKFKPAVNSDQAA